MPLDNITELKKRVPGGKYALARAVAERARQLQGGSMPLTEVKAPNPLSVAIDEIVQGKITFRMNAPEPENETGTGEPAAPQTADAGSNMMVGADKAAAESPVTGETATGSEQISQEDSAHEPIVSEANTKTSTDKQ